MHSKATKSLAEWQVWFSIAAGCAITAIGVELLREYVPLVGNFFHAHSEVQIALALCAVAGPLLLFGAFIEYLDRPR